MDFVIKKEFEIVRQEGDDASIEFTVPAEISLTNATCKFQVKDQTGKLLISKTSTSGIIKDGQSITVVLEPIDTTWHSGLHRWELEITDEDSYGIKTIGKGVFKILSQLITE